MPPFVPDTFEPPAGLTVGPVRLEPHGPQHNASDYAAWTASIDHIHATPGFEASTWPHEMTLAENLRDLKRHAADLAARTGFTYTVLTEDGAVVGCVYIYPSDSDGVDARVRSWVRADRAELDAVLYLAVRRWLRDTWPFDEVDYAPRS